jgi:diguanylate cyclase (GGDEF)-like protein
MTFGGMSNIIEIYRMFLINLIEEFSIMLPNTSKEIGILLAERLCKEIEKLKIDHADSKVSRYVTVSIGLATELGSEFAPLGPEKLFALADKALYKAKESGRNRVCYD